MEKEIFRYQIGLEGKLGSLYTGKEASPITADFCENKEGGMTLLRWPRLAGAAVLPEEIRGKKLTAIAATAFAPEHLEEELFGQMFDSVVSYSMFCMKMGKYVAAEALDEGGPDYVEIPESVERIGAYAFWKCRNLKEIRLPDRMKELPPGVFGECVSLKKVVLPGQLVQIGYMPKATQQIMPDVGAFAGCHSLKNIVLPKSLVRLGAQTFNSAGLEHLAVAGEPGISWKRKIEVDETAFSHAASLLWMDKITDEGVQGIGWAEHPAEGPDNKTGFVVAGHVEYRVGLPVAMDKILPGDYKFSAIKKIPADFFIQPAAYFDKLAQTAFRLDFSARMALARLVYDGGLSDEDRQWYLNLLVEYYGNAEQFMPPGKDVFRELFDFLKNRQGITAIQMSGLIRAAGEKNLSTELISHMMEVKNQKFHTVTGFEELEL